MEVSEETKQKLQQVQQETELGATIITFLKKEWVCKCLTWNIYGANKDGKVII